MAENGPQDAAREPSAAAIAAAASFCQKIRDASVPFNPERDLALALDAFAAQAVAAATRTAREPTIAEIEAACEAYARFGQSGDLRATPPSVPCVTAMLQAAQDVARWPRDLIAGGDRRQQPTPEALAFAENCRPDTLEDFAVCLDLYLAERAKPAASDQQQAEALRGKLDWCFMDGNITSKTIQEFKDTIAAALAEARRPLITALRDALLLAEEITDLEGREGITDADFAEQVIALAQEKLQVFRRALRDTP